jgi:glutamate-ammonia-ligase adenylyltransferase
MGARLGATSDDPARPVAGDIALAERFMALLDDFVWGRGLSDDEIREIRRIKRVERERIPPTDDPKFHLARRGSLGHRVRHSCCSCSTMRAPATITALDLLRGGVLEPADHATLIEAYRFCERTRNRLFLTSGGRARCAPAAASAHASARGRLDTTPTDLRRTTGE